MKQFFLYGLGLLWMGASCQSSEQQNTTQENTDSLTFTWEVMDTPTEASLRGLSVVSDQVVWASGQYGTVLRTTDGGQSWEQKPVPGIDSADFRDIEAFSDKVAYILAAGSPAYIFKTTDGGDSWVKQYENTSPDIFLDGLAFWDEEHGIAMGDPMDGYFTMLRTDDGGQLWERVPSEALPAPQEGEGGFAASGTNIITWGDRHVWFATGGGAARIFHSSDRGESWEVYDTPMTQGAPSQGTFSFIFTDSLYGLTVGGDYQNPEVMTRNAAYTTDGGKTWKPISEGPRGYRSGVTHAVSDNLFLAVGTSGSDYARDSVQYWQPLDTVGYHSIQSVPNRRAAWVSGGDGRIARVHW